MFGVAESTVCCTSPSSSATPKGANGLKQNYFLGLKKTNYNKIHNISRNLREKKEGEQIWKNNFGKMKPRITCSPKTKYGEKQLMMEAHPSSAASRCEPAWLLGHYGLSIML